MDIREEGGVIVSGGLRPLPDSSPELVGGQPQSAVDTFQYMRAIIESTRVDCFETAAADDRIWEV